ncbi:hypothetical protein DFH08DRAFT_381282 [Mycena albidolilacea]|uniref:Elongator complex protein 5 n=1 Tax=Mycena albidolilacea TaxID=1033008 RepID=A0AAD7AL61_9AGAR|nr:hypothetical protein DFH08DRAFT_381282 [Mycena albidolilacea]
MSFIREPRPRQQPFLLLQSSIAQSGIGIIHQLLEDASVHALLFCFLHSSLLSLQGPRVQTHDLLDNVAGYNDDYKDPRDHIRSAVKNVPAGPLDFVIDSVDTLASDIGSISDTYKFLSELLSLIRARSSPSRLVVHVLSPSPLLPLLCQPGFSPSLTHVVAHPPALLLHLSTEYLTLPPPLSPETKFWGIFLPVSERVHDSERLIFGAEGEGTGDHDELVVEVIVRGDGEGSRRRGVDRTLQGWSLYRGPCPLSEMIALKSLYTRNVVAEPPTILDPTQNVSFNLSLTASQQTSRAQVPLPYVHDGREKQSPVPAAIFYDPDSADDIDDDDPDEDLDI